MSGSTPSSTGTHPIEVRPRNSTLLVIFLSLGGLSFAVLQSMVAPALSSIAGDLKVSTSDVAWVLTAYLLSASVLTPILGRLGDMVGKRRILIIVLSVLLLGTVVSALANSLGILVLGRVLQGAAGAVLPLSIGIVRDELPRNRVGVTIGILSAIFGVGAGVGIVAAGPIVQNLNWHWLFWFPGIVVAIALLGAIFGMPESPIKTPGRLDIAGALVLSVSLVAILLAISNGQQWHWGNWKTVSLLILGGVALVAFVFVELRVKEPLVDVRQFRIRGVWTANIVALAFGFGMFGVFVLVPTLLQLPTILGYGFGKTVSQAGLLLLPTVGAMIVFGPLAGILVRRVGPKTPMLLGGLFVTAAFVLPAISHADMWQVILSEVFTGAGIGLALASMSNAIIEAVPATQTGEAISVNTIFRSIGSAIGTAVVAAVISSNTTPQGIPRDNAFTIDFWVCAGVAVVAVLAAIAAPSAMKRRAEAIAHHVDDFAEVEKTPTGRTSTVQS